MKDNKILEYAPAEYANLDYIVGLDEVLMVLTNFSLFGDIYHKTNNEKRKNLWQNLGSTNKRKY
jgi:hypothetical protein